MAFLRDVLIDLAQFLNLCPAAMALPEMRFNRIFLGRWDFRTHRIECQRMFIEVLHRSQNLYP